MLKIRNITKIIGFGLLERGYEVVVCVPVKSGKDIKRRRGFIRCAANDRNCFVDVAGAKDNAPSATISFDLADLQAVAKGTNKDTKPSWNLDPDRIIRFSIVARPELLFEFERDSRDTFHQSFSDAVKNRLYLLRQVVTLYALMTLPTYKQFREIDG
jgi:hypothetical protein